MRPMTKRERVEATLHGAATDRVPVYDLLLNDAAITHFNGAPAPLGEDGVRAKCRAIGRMLDMTRSADGGPRTPGESTDADGFTHRYERWTGGGIRVRPFTDEAGARRWLEQAVERRQQHLRAFDPRAHRERFRARFLTVQGYIGDDTVQLLSQTGTGLDDVRYALGLELFSYLEADVPELLSAFLEVHTALQEAQIHAIADPALSPCCLTYTDIAYKGKLLHSPAYLRREVLPRVARLNAAWHAHGIKCLFHSDGQLMDILPDLIATGIDGLNPIETVAGMSLAGVRAVDGGRLFLAGGIDISQLMAHGTPAQVRAACAAAIAAAGPGYFIGSTTELDDGSRLENILTMLDVAWHSGPVRGRAKGSAARL